MAAKRSVFTMYSSLLTALNRSKIKHPGRVATFLLETFVYTPSEWATIKKEQCVERKILKENDSFIEFRKSLTNAGFLEWKMKGKEQAIKDNLYQASLYKPGHKLVEYLNKEILKNHQVATKSDLTILQEQVADLSSRMRSIEEHLTPPVTEEKIEKARNLTLVK